jgi:hypothetical protein
MRTKMEEGIYALNGFADERWNERVDGKSIKGK